MGLRSKTPLLIDFSDPDSNSCIKNNLKLISPD